MGTLEVSPASSQREDVWRNVIYVLNDRGSTTPLTLLRTLVPTVPNSGHRRSSEVFHEYIKKVEIAQQKIGR